MRPTWTHLTLAAAALLAAPWTPTLAQDACSVCGDPTWPALEQPAGAVTLTRDAAGERPTADPTWPLLDAPAPSFTLRLPPSSAEVRDPTWPVP